MDCKLCVYVFWCATFYCFTGYFPMQLFRKSRQTLVFNKFKTCLKNSNTREVQYYNI